MSQLALALVQPAPPRTDGAQLPHGKGIPAPASRLDRDPGGFASRTTGRWPGSCSARRPSTSAARRPASRSRTRWTSSSGGPKSVLSPPIANGGSSSSCPFGSMRLGEGDDDGATALVVESHCDRVLLLLAPGRRSARGGVVPAPLPRRIPGQAATAWSHAGHRYVPRISEFYGLVISMYHNEHGPPHFHAKHGGQEAVLSLAGVMLRGTLPPRALRLVGEWAAIHRGKLRQNWIRARKGQDLERIPPLE